MEATPRYMGLNDFVEELSRHLVQVEMVPAPRTRELILDALEIATRRFLEHHLSPAGLSFALWKFAAEAGSKGIEPAIAFGTEFIPDMVITVGDEPTLAIVAQPILRRQDMSHRIALAIGRALVCARQYPAALAFISYRAGQDVAYKHLLDYELRTALWNSCKVKVVLR